VTKEQRAAVARLQRYPITIVRVTRPDVVDDEAVEALRIILDMLAETKDRRAMVVSVPRQEPWGCDRTCLLYGWDGEWAMEFEAPCLYSVTGNNGTHPGPGCPWYEEEK
jgi:hypothetical protein